MGDWSDSLGMNSIKRLIEDNTPEGMYVHSLKIGGDGSGIDSHVSEVKYSEVHISLSEAA